MKQTTFNFKERFVPMVECGDKVSTIRVFARTQPPAIGDTLKLFVGMRTKKCRKLKEVKCSAVFVIVINAGCVRLGPRFLSTAEIGKIVQADGFHNFAEMKEFFRTTYGLPFKGWWVTWV